MSFIKELGRSRAAQRGAGTAIALFLKFVWATSRRITDPADFDERARALGPVIVALWHGQHMLTALAAPPGTRYAVLISRHRDGEVQAAAIRAMGMKVVRGSGAATPGDQLRKGGAAAFRELLGMLEAGYSVTMTADVPKGPARLPGEGIIRLAQHSGRPILPVAVATRRRRVFDRSWDRAVMNLPFTRAARVLGDPIHVPPDTTDLAVWQARVKTGLDTVTARAHALLGIRDVFEEDAESYSDAAADRA